MVFMAHRLQLGLTSEYERFNGSTAYVEGSTAENPQAVMMFFNLPNHWSVERIESSMGDKTQLAEAKRIIHAANNYDALRAQNAQLLAALRPFAEYFDGDLATIGGGTMVSLQFKLQLFKDAKAAIAAAESEGE